jgi:transcriptional regulator with XRE-family HTH domain
MTANQVIAYNLKRAREALNMTQQQAALDLERYLGRRWSPASFSVAERSADNGRVREFDANEIVAFSQVFNRPIGWFFTPPDDVEFVECGPPGDAWQSVRRERLIQVAGPVMEIRREYADQLRNIAMHIEMGDEPEPTPPKPKARPRKRARKEKK